MDIAVINAIDNGSETITEGDTVLIKDNWQYDYTGVVTYLDADVIEITNRSGYSKAFDVGAIISVSKTANKY